MWRFKIIGIILSILMLFGNCTGKEAAFDFSKHDFLISSNGDKSSVEAADYLYNHLLKRTRKDEAFQIIRQDNAVDEYKGATIYLEIVPDLAYDYEIRNDENRLSVFGKDKAIMVWLSYMLIDRMAAFHDHIDVSDLAPGYIDFKSGVGKFTMQYREPHLPPNTNPDYAGTLGTHSVDKDWGLWGHNLEKVFVDGAEDSSYAWVDGKRNKQQFCFSSESTFKAIKNFVIDEYGDGKESSKWFMIAPNDNELVCTCSACKKAGNTSNMATGSVVRLLNRLAKEFPKHYFFTMAYLTTAEAPKVPMENNTGVFVSTIDLPKRPALDSHNPDVRAFMNLLRAWKEKTGHIYLWDYISNFDDYLTPYPVLSRLQANLPFFTSQGVNGIFLNGSGYDYSAFDDVKTYVMAALLHDSSLSIERLVKDYFLRFYPVTNEYLSSYYLTLEHRGISNNKELPIYLSFRKAEQLFFNSEEFLQLYGKLNKELSGLDGDERNRVDKLLTAWSYTYLQVLYHSGSSANGFISGTEPDWKISDRVNKLLNRLKGYQKYENLKSYKESQGEIATYIDEWHRLLEEDGVLSKAFTDLRVRELNTANVLEDGYLLGDRVLGFPSDFNQGWFLSSKSIEIEGEIADEVDSVKKLTLRFLVNQRHRMLAPADVDILKNGVSQGKVSEKSYKYQGNVAYMEFPLNMKPGEKIQIKIRKSVQIENSVIACDEIQLF